MESSATNHWLINVQFCRLMTGMSSHFNLILTEMMGNILLLMQIEALETFTLFTGVILSFFLVNFVILSFFFVNFISYVNTFILVTAVMNKKSHIRGIQTNIALAYSALVSEIIEPPCFLLIWYLLLHISCIRQDLERRLFDNLYLWLVSTAISYRWTWNGESYANLKKYIH